MRALARRGFAGGLAAWALAAVVRAEPPALARLPEITAVDAPACLSPGAELSVRGAHLGEGDRGWTLERGGVPLETSVWTDGAIRARVPSDPGAESQGEASAPLLLRSRSGAVLARSERDLVLCEKEPVELSPTEIALRGIRASERRSRVPLSASRAAVLGELLVTAPDAATADAIERSASALTPSEPPRRLQLGSLGLVMLWLRFPDEGSAQSAELALRRDHPQAEIVRNLVYRPDGSDAVVTAAAAAAKVHEVVGWPAHPDCGRGWRIGIVDTGFDTSHGELSEARVTVQDIRRVPSQRVARHGTAVASLLVGKSVGLLPRAELYAVPAFWEQDGEIISSSRHMVEAVAWLADQRVDVINLSLEAQQQDTAVARALRAAEVRGIRIVAAAGNAGPDRPIAFPASLPDVVAVTAVDAQLHVYERAAQGAEIDFAAPGVNVLVADSRGGLTTESGTSFAVPFVAAALALSPRGLRGLIDAARDLGSPGKDSVFGWGLLNADGLCGAPGAARKSKDGHSPDPSAVALGGETHGTRSVHRMAAARVARGCGPARPACTRAAE